MNLFLLSVLCVAREFVDAVESIHRLSLMLEWRFQGHQSLFFADDFWSVGTQFSLTIQRVNDDSVFSNDFIRKL